MGYPAARPTGRGAYGINRNADGDITVQLSNFDIDGSGLKPDHKEILRASVLEILKNGGSVAILGHASTTGDASHDEVLSAQRAGEVLKFLRAEGGTGFFVNTIDYRGKATALALTGKDNTEDARWRTVWVRAWTNKNPPPDIGVLPIEPGVPLPTDPLLSKLNDGLSLVGGALSVVDLGVDIAATYSAAAGLATAGIVTGVGGLVLTCVAGIIGMPALWASVDAMAEANGKMQGYADAMQDMAAGFSDDALDRKTMKDWPAIPTPVPHIFATPTSTPQQFWHRGQQWGCNQARIDVLKVQAEPIEVDAKLKNGTTRKMKINGKFMLRSAWVSTKGEVGGAVMQKFNDRLDKAGKPHFPIH